MPTKQDFANFWKRTEKFARPASERGSPNQYFIFKNLTQGVTLDNFNYRVYNFYGSLK